METQEFSFITSTLPVTDDAVRAELQRRGLDPTTDARWFASQNHPSSLDEFVEVLYRPGSGQVQWQQGDSDYAPALRPQDWQDDEPSADLPPPQTTEERLAWLAARTEVLPEGVEPTRAIRITEEVES